MKTGSALPRCHFFTGVATPSQQNFQATQEAMKNTKFMVKVVRGTRAAEYVQRIDRSPVQTTLKRNLALVMGKLTAEDVVNFWEIPAASRNSYPSKLPSSSTS
jgi:hypothetical protein